jgi:hypothetical protein
MDGNRGNHFGRERDRFVNSGLLSDAIGCLIAKAGFCGDFHLHQLTGGSNNKVFRVDMGGSCALLKVYFQHPDDPRDRLGAEYGFCRFAWEHGLRTLPKPWACDVQHRLGLYEFIEGRQPQPHEITEKMVTEAASFYLELNQHRKRPRALELPSASEACFSTSDHLRCVERRLQRLHEVNGTSDIDREALSFVRNDLSRTWEKVLDTVKRRAREIDLPLDAEIEREESCLSPSDFGFHNAICTSGDSLRFIDFEYAGWDDPSKLVCDFFCQPAIPAPLDCYESFADAVVSVLPNRQMHLQRMAILLPVYQIKWCCILLNDFLPAGIARRNFACSNLVLEEQKAMQLKKAHQALRAQAQP